MIKVSNETLYTTRTNKDNQRTNNTDNNNSVK